MRIRVRLYIAIQLVPSDWLMRPPVGSGELRSKTPMLSRPRNPPWKMFRPAASLRFAPGLCDTAACFVWLVAVEDFGHLSQASLTEMPFKRREPRLDGGAAVAARLVDLHPG